MNTTTIIIIFVFVFTILSASMRGGVPREPGRVFSQVEITMQPNPTFLSVTAENPRDKIEKFILSYSKNISFWDAGIMAESIVKYSERYDVNPKLVTALIARESRFNPYAVSSSGAQGLGQLLPSTAASMDIYSPFDIDQNVMGTTRYFKLMLDRWEGNSQQVALALACYKEGHGAVTRNGGYSNHTRGYIEDILKIYWSI